MAIISFIKASIFPKVDLVSQPGSSEGLALDVFDIEAGFCDKSNSRAFYLACVEVCKGFRV